MDSYCENTFLNGFMDIYDVNDEYDFTILFDEYYYRFVATNSMEFLKNVFQYYDNIEDHEDLYHHLYHIVEQMILDKCESEADTDVDE